MRRLLLLATALAVASCSGNGATRLDDAAGQLSVKAPPLPVPGALPRASSELGGPFRRDGGEFRADLPHNEVAASGSNDGRFTPDDSAGRQDLANLSYALYEWNYPDFSEDYALTMSWKEEPAAGQLFFAFANWERNSWDWQHPEPASIVTLPFDADYFSGDGRLLVAVVVRGASPATLDYLSLGLSKSYPPEARLSVTPGSGSAPQLVSYYAGGSFDPDGEIVLYELDADGDGSFEVSGSDPPLDQRLFEENGEFDLSLRVTDNSGLTDTAIVTLPLGVIAWRPAPTGFQGISSDVIWDFEGGPALTFTEDQVLYFAAALDAQAEEWSEPASIDDSTDAAFLVSLAMVDGHPAVAYVANPNGDYELRYCRALDPQGQDWGPIEYLEVGTILDRVSLATVHGHPAIAYGIEGGGHADPRYVRALDPQGDEWGDPVTCDGGASDSLEVFSEFSFRMSRLVVYRDRPGCIFRAGAFGDPELYYFCYSDDALGLEWPEAKLIAETADSGGFSTMQPLVLNRSFGPELAAFGLVDGELRLYRRSTQPGNDWYFGETLHTIAEGYATQSVAAAIVQGNPAVLIQENSAEDSRLVYCRAIDEDGQSWPASPDTLSFLGDDDGSNSWPGLGELDGLPAVFTTNFEGDLTRYLKH